jgi:hypothetical protein
LELNPNRRASCTDSVAVAAALKVIGAAAAHLPLGDVRAQFANYTLK